MFGTLGNQQQMTQQQQQQALDEFAVLCAAVTTPVVFNDERDQILAKWNQLQAFWGKGKVFAQSNASVEVKPDNRFCCLKAVGYSVLPTKKNEEGLVGLITNKNKEELVKHQQSSVTFLSNLLGNKPTLSVCVDDIRELPGGRSELIVYVIERQANGNTKKIDATELSAYFEQSHVRSKLLEAGVEVIAPKAGLNAENFRAYLANPPAGLDAALWEQAKKDNPDPSRMVPVPMLGFTELASRMKHQEEQAKLHKARLELIQENMAKLRQSHTSMLARTEEFKRKHIELSHRVLCVAARQEVHRKSGTAVTVEEEQLRTSLEALHQELNAPTKFKGRLNELLSQIRLQTHLQDHPSATRRACEAASQHPGFDKVLEEADVKSHLKQQQEGLRHLVSILQEDIKDTKLMLENLQTAGK